jgi:hypothetical protein
MRAQAIQAQERQFEEDFARFGEIEFEETETASADALELLAARVQAARDAGA